MSPSVFKRGIQLTHIAVTAPLQTIQAFHQDEAGHWVARLACGHGQHVRHDPPWQNRPWTQTEQGRKQQLGATLPCMKCLRHEAIDVWALKQKLFNTP